MSGPALRPRAPGRATARAGDPPPAGRCGRGVAAPQTRWPTPGPAPRWCRWAPPPSPIPVPDCASSAGLGALAGDASLGVGFAGTDLVAARSATSMHAETLTWRRSSSRWTAHRPDDALALVDRLGAEAAPSTRSGLELFTRARPPRGARTLAGRGKRVFLDLKLHDIPNTVAGAVRAAAALDVELLTVHGSGGAGMLEAARDAAEGGSRLLAVTLLTVADPLRRRGGVGPGDRLHPRRGRRASRSWRRTCGMDGVVASALEASWLRRALGDGFLIVTPGIRPAGEDRGDQRRVATPTDAVEAGVGLPRDRAPRHAGRRPGGRSGSASGRGRRAATPSAFADRNPTDHREHGTQSPQHAHALPRALRAPGGGQGPRVRLRPHHLRLRPHRQLPLRSSSTTWCIATWSGAATRSASS